jgi:hypothetical protein
MYLMYVDESGDCGMTKSPSRYFVLTGLVVHEVRWTDCLEKLIEFRRRMRDVAERDIGASFERIDGATRASGRGAVRSVRTAAQLGTRWSARSEVEHDMWRDEA